MPYDHQFNTVISIIDVNKHEVFKIKPRFSVYPGAKARFHSKKCCPDRKVCKENLEKLRRGGGGKHTVISNLTFKSFIPA